MGETHECCGLSLLQVSKLVEGFLDLSVPVPSEFKVCVLNVRIHVSQLCGWPPVLFWCSCFIGYSFCVFLMPPSLSPPPHSPTLPSPFPPQHHKNTPASSSVTPDTALSKHQLKKQKEESKKVNQKSKHRGTMWYSKALQACLCLLQSQSVNG